jgi:hypothetical protein
MPPLVQRHAAVVWTETEVMQECLSSQCSYVTGNKVLILEDGYKLEAKQWTSGKWGTRHSVLLTVHLFR